MDKQSWKIPPKPEPSSFDGDPIDQLGCILGQIDLDPNRDGYKLDRARIFETPSEYDKADFKSFEGREKRRLNIDVNNKNCPSLKFDPSSDKEIYQQLYDHFDKTLPEYSNQLKADRFKEIHGTKGWLDR